jgi:hypothetical protein
MGSFSELDAQLPPDDDRCAFRSNETAELEKKFFQEFVFLLISNLLPKLRWENWSLRNSESNERNENTKMGR